MLQLLGYTYLLHCSLKPIKVDTKNIHLLLNITFVTTLNTMYMKP